MRFPYWLRLCAAASLVLQSGWVQSQGSAAAYPSKPVTLIVTAAPGGPNEREARLYGTKMHELLGQPFIVDFKVGAGTTIGAAYVAKSAPDGYTCLVVTGTFTIFPSMYKNLTFDTLRDFAAVTQMTERTNILIASPTFPAKTFGEYIAYAKANPGKINYGTSGAGGSGHLSGAWMHSVTNTKVTFVHYKGSTPMMVDLAGGRLDVTPATYLSGLPLLKGGKARVLVVLNDKRSKLLPGVPTVAEQGVPGFNHTDWTGIVVPSGVPAAIITRLNAGFAKAAHAPEVASSLEPEGSTMVGGTPAQFRQVLINETERWRKVVQDNQITLEE